MEKTCEEKLAVETEARIKAETALLQLELDKILLEEDILKEKIKDYNPVLKVITCKNGTWIEYENLDIFVEHIEHIKCTNIGWRPLITNEYYYGNLNGCPLFVKPAQDAIITITMFSGLTHPISVHRFFVDFLLAEIRAAWRKYR